MNKYIGLHVEIVYFDLEAHSTTVLTTEYNTRSIEYGFRILCDEICSFRAI